MVNSHKFFNNHECKYFPCHTMPDKDNFNCLYCYCPLYPLGDKCGGNFKYIENEPCQRDLPEDTRRPQGAPREAGIMKRALSVFAKRKFKNKSVKNCVECHLPHIPEYYDTIISKLKEPKRKDSGV